MNQVVQETRKPDYSKLSGCDAWVLGAGVSGLTTAIVLQSLGVKTGIVSEALPYELASGRGIPQVPSLAAMASAYPHNLQVRNLMQISDNTQLVFNQLLTMPDSGISIYRMFEVFEEAPEGAPLSSRRRGFQSFEGTARALKSTINPPVRTGAEYLWGWTFETVFADMPVYLHFLHRFFLSRGGVIENGWLERDHVLAAAGSRPLFNCLGWRGRDLFDDTAPETIVRGKQVLVPAAPLVLANDGMPLCYNYTPVAEAFSRADGKPEYLHFFPRTDAWILGQTREPGRFDHEGRWFGDEVIGEKRLVGDELIPSPIVDVNADILKNWTGHQLNGRSMFGREAYRYYRDPQHTGVRLNCEKFENSLVFHNYGHGGSGITMSWGCAIEAARTFVKNTKPAMPKNAGSKLDRILITALDG